MNVPIITLFNNKGGVGKTSLVYHLAWMFSEMGVRVIAVDLDPQANLTAAFLDENRLEEIWPEGEHPKTIFGCLRPRIKGTGDISNAALEPIENRLALISGDLALSTFEDNLSEAWPKCMMGDEASFRVISAFWRIIQRAQSDFNADLILIDLGPNLGAINRAALIASNFVVIPLAPDLFSLQGLKNLGPTFRSWRRHWAEMVKKNKDPQLELPPGSMSPLGYVIMQYSVRLDRPVRAYDYWMEKIPSTYREYVLDESAGKIKSVSPDANCLALVKHFRSLVPMAQEAHKPVFHLTPADGAMGSHQQNVQEAYSEFKQLAKTIAARADVTIP